MSKKKRRVYDNLDLLETSAVGIPAYPEATLEYKYKEEDSMVEKEPEAQQEEPKEEQPKEEPKEEPKQEEAPAEEPKEEAEEKKAVTLEQLETFKDKITDIIKEEVSKLNVEKQGLVEKEEKLKAENKKEELKYSKENQEEFLDKAGKALVDCGFFKV